MKVSTNWLQQYVGRTMSARQMADSLELAGIEVEQIISPIIYDKHIVSALVKKVVQHPNADKLRLVTVDTGQAELEIVCGAPNVAEAQVVVLAGIGSLLPDGTLIAEAKLRGVTSMGMLCSPRELAMSDDHAGILVLEPGIKPGTALCDIVKNSEILDISTPANRFDILSLVGLAREIAARNETGILLPESSALQYGDGGPAARLMVDSDYIQRYTLTSLSIASQKLSNDHIQQQLKDSGMRPIQAAVDLTNYTLLETGQPLHAFDASKVALPITVRMAQAGEKLVMLDGVERTLSSEDMVIADQDGAIALAGVMGGRRTAVGMETTDILLEAAIFAPGPVRKSAVRHGIRTDASARYERGLPTQLTDFGLSRALRLFADNLDAKQVGDTTDIAPQGALEATLRQINIHPDRICNLLGIKLSAEEITNHFQSLELKVASESDASLSVEIPWWRTDLRLGEDLVEEVVRLIGYEAIPATLPNWQPTSLNFDHRRAQLWKMKAALKARGLFEVLTYSFVSAEQLQTFSYPLEDHLKLSNPLSVEQAYLRSNLLPSLLGVVSRNVGYSKKFGVYEMSKVFRKNATGELPAEDLQLAVMLRGWPLGYAGVKQILDVLVSEFRAELNLVAKDYDEFHPGRSACIEHDGHALGRIGELHPEILDAHRLPSGQVFCLELEVDAFLNLAREKQYQDISKYPSVWRDLALVLSEKVRWSDVLAELGELAGVKVTYLNEFQGADIAKGQKSLAMRLEITSMKATLTDKQADDTFNTILAKLESKFEAKLRA